METSQTTTQAICSSIAAALSSKEDLVQQDQFLSSKNVGALLFLCHYQEAPLADKAEQKIVQLCESIIEELYAKANDSDLTFSSGLIGYGWLLAFLENEENFEFDAAELHQQIQSIALDFALTEISEWGNLDFFHGGLGSAFYLLERHQKEDQSIALRQILVALEAKSIKVKQGIYWPDWNAASEQKKENCNLGVAHGLPSVLYFLSRLVKNDIEKIRAQKLLKESIGFLLQCKNTPDSKSIFPSIFSFTEPKGSSRIGWCYGDLGIALVLYTVAEALQEENLKQEAIDLCLHCTQRISFEETKILDAGLCHGTIGASHLYHRMFLNTGRVEFQNAANLWKEKTVELSNKTDGLAGFQLWNPGTGWENSFGFLEGIAGIGLALLAQESGRDPKWDRMLLIS